VLADTTLVIFFTADIADAKAETAIEALILVKAGKSVSQDMCPKQVWNEKGRKKRIQLPHLFLASGSPIVSAKAAAVLRQFDLGGGGLYPLEGAYQSDRTTRIPGDYFCWIFGNLKSAFLGDQSPAARPFAPNAPVPTGRWSMPLSTRMTN
jgi:hypothetical protein